MKRNFILNWIGLAGLMGLLGCFTYTLFAEVCNISIGMRTVTMGWGLSAGAVVFSLVEGLFRLARRKRKLQAQAYQRESA